MGHFVLEHFLKGDSGVEFERKWLVGRHVLEYPVDDLLDVVCVF
jgi:hypothetical protein